MKCHNCGFENDEHANFCKKCGTKLVVEKTNDNSNLNQDNGINKWAIILTTIAISLMIIIAAGGMINQHSESNSVTNENGNGNGNYMMNSNLIIHNGTWGSTIHKGEPMYVQLKDSNWEAMDGCLVSLTVINKENGEQSDGDCIIGEDSYAYVDIDDLPIGTYELNASYYGDENHNGATYTDTIEIVD